MQYFHHVIFVYLSQCTLIYSLLICGLWKFGLALYLFVWIFRLHFLFFHTLTLVSNRCLLCCRCSNRWHSSPRFWSLSFAFELIFLFTIFDNIQQILIHLLIFVDIIRIINDQVLLQIKFRSIHYQRFILYQLKINLLPELIGQECINGMVE